MDIMPLVINNNAIVIRYKCCYCFQKKIWHNIVFNGRLHRRRYKKERLLLLLLLLIIIIIIIMYIVHTVSFSPATDPAFLSCEVHIIYCW